MIWESLRGKTRAGDAATEFVKTIFGVVGPRVLESPGLCVSHPMGSPPTSSVAVVIRTEDTLL